MASLRGISYALAQPLALCLWGRRAGHHRQEKFSRRAGRAGLTGWLPVSLTPLALIRQAVADGVQPEMAVAFDAQPSYWALSLKDPSGETPGQRIIFQPTRWPADGLAIGRCTKPRDASAIG